MVCALVGWLLKTGQLPANTASVLSRVGGSTYGASAAPPALFPARPEQQVPVGRWHD